MPPTDMVQGLWFEGPSNERISGSEGVWGRTREDLEGIRKDGVTAANGSRTA